ncbi:hypothetical protein HA466_0104280 [Hirschfeldia incana]|nr:hypothetical protein HA466_0104280 [Hirschfeldia incana]
MVFVTVHDFHSMCQKHCHYLLKKEDHSMRSMLLALLFLSFTWLSLLKYGTVATAASKLVEPDHHELLPLLLNDLEKEGLFKLGDKALLLSGGDDEVTVASYSQTVIETEVLFVSASDEETQSKVPNETFDFAFAHTRHIDSAEFLDRALKVGGILTVQLNLQDLPPNFLEHLNYEIVYMKSSEYTVMAMRKTGETEEKQGTVATGRKLLTTITEEEAKKNALSKLEDVLLEPPRAASRKSRTYLKRTRYLPDLMGDTMDLGSYSRRVFIDVGNGKGSSGTEWFVKNYPTRNLKFEMYKIKTVNDEMSLESENMGMTEWLKENVKEKEYVVMKAEAEVVEEMMRSKSIKMVDELFLECKPKGLGLRARKMQSKSGKAYWECLALYGKLRDEGVAVHQWWG